MTTTPTRKPFDKLASEFEGNIREIARLQALGGSTEKEIQDELGGADPDDAGGIQEKDQILSRLRLRAELLPAKIAQYQARNQFIEQTMRAEIELWKPAIAASAKEHYDTVVGKLSDSLKPACRRPEIALELAGQTDLAKEMWGTFLYSLCQLTVGDVPTGDTFELLKLGRSFWSNWETFIARNAL